MLTLSACSTHQQLSTKTLSPHYSLIQKGQIEYYQFGHGSPIILIAGYATDVTSWNSEFLATLAEQHQVIVFNNRNIGKSLVQSSSYENKDLANDTYQLIQNLKLKKPAVIGISMGGMIAQELAILHPEKLGQLILINTAIAGKDAIHPSPAVEKKMMNMPANKLGRYFVAVNLFFPTSCKLKMAYALAAQRFIPTNYIEIDPQAIMPQQRQLVMNWIHDDAAAKKIKKLDLPVLILNGESDVVIPPDNSVILADTIPNAQLIRWKQGGHAMIYQFPQQIANEVDEFITESSSVVE